MHHRSLSPTRNTQKRLLGSAKNLGFSKAFMDREASSETFLQTFDHLVFGLFFKKEMVVLDNVLYF
jgi:hypothetical protein